MTFSQNNGQTRSINDLQLIENRMIRVFVSSTFLDMTAERKYLIERTFPKVRAYCQKKNVGFVELDLRWGITVKEANSGKVTEICLQEIERTRPFFIGLLGERYGWIPKPGEIDQRTLEEDRFPWLEQDVLDQRSITEVEMQYGVLRSKTDLNAFFYFRSPKMFTPDEFRDAVGSPQAEKLKNLKQAIRDQKKYPVAEYLSVEDLGRVDAKFVIK